LTSDGASDAQSEDAEYRIGTIVRNPFLVLRVIVTQGYASVIIADQI